MKNDEKTDNKESSLTESVHPRHEPNREHWKNQSIFHRFTTFQFIMELPSDTWWLSWATCVTSFVAMELNVTFKHTRSLTHTSTVSSSSNIWWKSGWKTRNIWQKWIRVHHLRTQILRFLRCCYRLVVQCVLLKLRYYFTKFFGFVIWCHQFYCCYKCYFISIFPIQIYFDKFQCKYCANEKVKKRK